MPSITKESLSEPCARLAKAMHRIDFGRIEDLQVCAGEPVFDPPPRIIQEIKIGCWNQPRPVSANFGIKRQIVELFEHLRWLGDGKIDCIEVRYGLPFRVILERKSDLCCGN